MFHSFVTFDLSTELDWQCVAFFTSASIVFVVFLMDSRQTGCHSCCTSYAEQCYCGGRSSNQAPALQCIISCYTDAERNAESINESFLFISPASVITRLTLTKPVQPLRFEDANCVACLVHTDWGLRPKLIWNAVNRAIYNQSFFLALLAELTNPSAVKLFALALELTPPVESGT
ncbi:hypothetical protein BaRGS_00006779 [Batillaria attramentaria]|uniref:Uncharacterized protein n=1 Tax=Batillaria attramentaria TaxID=370345 RepID=A0ABD0LRR6_9CAEN